MNEAGHKREERRWFAAAIALALFYSALALRLAFRFPDSVQDDARQHVFWMARFRDPGLFPNDWIADYFQAVAPAGYKALYWIFAQLGVDPLLLSKLLPAVIGLATAIFAFKLFMQLRPSPRGAFLASAFIGQIIWLQDDVISATPRAFACCLLLAFLLFLLREKRFACLWVIALAGLIYPQIGILSIAILGVRLINWDGMRPRLSTARTDYVFLGGAILVLALVVLPFASSVSRYRPVFSRADAIALPEFQEDGRSEFFGTGAEFWFDHPRSGFFPNDVPPHFLLLALALPWLYRSRQKFLSLKESFQAGPLFLSLGLAALGMWVAAHLLLFKLHLPGRYSQTPLRILIAIAAALALSAIWDALLQTRARLNRQGNLGGAKLIAASIVVGIAALLAFPHLTSEFPKDSYLRAQPKALFDFLRTQPKDSIIVSLHRRAGIIPVFAQRSILASAEHAIPYHRGYYRVLRERGRDMIRAHLTSRPEELRAFLEQNDVDFLIVERNPITAEQIKKLLWFKEIARPEDLLPSISPPLLAGLVERTKVWENKTAIVLDAHRILEALPAHATSP